MKKMLALLVLLSGFGFAGAMDFGDALDLSELNLSAEELKFAEEQAAKNIQEFIEEIGGNKDLLKTSLIERIKRLGQNVFVDNTKNAAGCMLLVVGSVFAQAVLVYEIIFAAVLLYSCLYGVGVVAGYFLTCGNILTGCSPAALFSFAHDIYIGVLSYGASLGVITGAFIAVASLSKKIYANFRGSRVSVVFETGDKLPSEVVA